MVIGIKIFWVIRQILWGVGWLLCHDFFRVNLWLYIIIIYIGLSIILRINFIVNKFFRLFYFCSFIRFFLSIFLAGISKFQNFSRKNFFNLLNFCCAYQFRTSYLRLRTSVKYPYAKRLFCGDLLVTKRVSEYSFLIIFYLRFF